MQKRVWVNLPGVTGGIALFDYGTAIITNKPAVYFRFVDTLRTGYIMAVQTAPCRFFGARQKNMRFPATDSNKWQCRLFGLAAILEVCMWASWFWSVFDVRPRMA